MKNGYRITDAHAHVFPDKIAEKATEGISHFYDLPMQYHGRVAEMLENGTAAGIDHFLYASGSANQSSGSFRTWDMPADHQWENSGNPDAA